MWQRRNMHRTGQNGRRQMADISAEIKKFKDAVYGKDVRGSMISLAEKVNAETEKTTKLAQDTGKKVEGFNQRIEDNKSAVEELRNDHNNDIASLTQNKADAIINTATGEHIAVGDSSGHLLDNLKIYGKTIQSGEPTPDKLAPMNSTGDKGKIEIGIHGKQLFDASKIPTKSAGGATVTNNGDGSFTIIGNGELTQKNEAAILHTREETIRLLRTGKITLKGVKSRPSIGFAITNKDGAYIDKSLNDIETVSVEITETIINDEYAKLKSYYYGNIGNTIKSNTVKPMLYQDGDGTWEPFAPLQSLSIPTPDNLRGIPVESGGNYIDATGQEWVSDVIDLKTGKRTQHIEKIVLNGTEDFTLQSINTHGIANFVFKLPKAAENKIAISNYFKKQDTVIADTTTEGFMISSGYTLYIRAKQERANTVEKFKEWLKTHNVTVIYGLAKPIEKDIPQETLTAYKKLHSNYPSTVIQNDSGAGMELSYVADTKNYTGNKIKEAVSTQMQNLANLLSLMPLSTQAAMIETDTNRILDNMEVQK